MPRLITVQISRCPECGEDNWLLWELDVGEDASSIAKVEDEYRTAANVRRRADISENHWKATFAWPFKLFDRSYPHQDYAIPTSPNVARCLKCGFERTFSSGARTPPDADVRTMDT